MGTLDDFMKYFNTAGAAPEAPLPNAGQPSAGPGAGARGFERFAGANIPPTPEAAFDPAKFRAGAGSGQGLGARVGATVSNAANSAWDFLNKSRSAWGTAKDAAFGAGKVLKGMTPSALVGSAAGGVASAAAGGSFLTGANPMNQDMLYRALGEGYARYAPTFAGGLPRETIAAGDQFGASNIEGTVERDAALAAKEARPRGLGAAPAAPAAATQSAGADLVTEPPAAGRYGAARPVSARAPLPTGTVPEVPVYPTVQPTGMEDAVLPGRSMADPATAGAFEQEAFNRGQAVAYGSAAMPAPHQVADGGTFDPYNRQVVQGVTTPGGFGAGVSTVPNGKMEVIKGMDRSLFDPATRSYTAQLPAGTSPETQAAADAQVNGIHPALIQALTAERGANVRTGMQGKTALDVVGAQGKNQLALSAANARESAARQGNSLEGLSLPVVRALVEAETDPKKKLDIIRSLTAQPTNEKFTFTPSLDGKEVVVGDERRGTVKRVTPAIQAPVAKGSDGKHYVMKPDGTPARLATEAEVKAATKK